MIDWWWWGGYWAGLGSVGGGGGKGNGRGQKLRRYKGKTKNYPFRKGNDWRNQKQTGTIEMPIINYIPQS